jgi:hypothetical protein
MADTHFYALAVDTATGLAFIISFISKFSNSNLKKYEYSISR